MKMTGICRKTRRSLPIVIVVLIMYIYYSYWTTEENIQSNKPTTLEHIIESPAPRPTGVWLLAAASDGNLCISLAASFPLWNVFLVLPKPTEVTHSRCRFLTIAEIKDELDEGLIALFGNDTAGLAVVVGTQRVIKYKPSAVFVAPTTNLDVLDVPNHIKMLDSSRLVYTHPGLFPTNRHFGCNLNRDESDWGLNSYRYCETSPVIHAPSLISYSASNRLGEISLKCDTCSPSVVLDYGSYGFVTFESGMFKNAFTWAAGIDLIATAAHENRFLINMGLQKIIWRFAHRIETYCNSVRMEEIELSTAQEWIELTEKWTGSEDMIQTSVLNFMLYLRDKEKLKHSTFKIIQKYLSKLQENGFEFLNKRSVDIEEESGCQNEPVSFYPVDFQRSAAPRKIPVNNVQQLDYIYNKMCDANVNSRKKISFTSPWIQFQDILLVVVFNKPHYEALLYVELLYSSFFPHLLFCGPEFPDREKFSYLYDSNGVLSRTFISYGRTPEGRVPGAFNYACLTKATNLQFNVTGYLVIADDTLLLVNNIKDFRRDVVWFLPKKEMRIGEISKLRECKLGMCDFFPHWAWWDDYQSNIIALLNHMREEQENSLLIYNCYRQLVQLNGGPLRPSGGYSDVYYIPQRLAGEFAELASLFLEYQIFLEIAVPTIIRCLEHPADIIEMQNKVIWDFDRDEPWKYFTKHHLFGKSFYHPAKWGYLTVANTSKLFKDFYCDTVLPFLHDPLERLPKGLTKVS